MDIMTAIKERHSVRDYTDKVIEVETAEKLREKIEELNERSGLNMQIMLNEKGGFGNFVVKYGLIKNVKNYIAVVGKKGENLDETAGYYGEELVIYAQRLGLNTCWVGVPFIRDKCACEIGKDEKLVCVIAIGYGANQGFQHKNKPFEKLCKVDGQMPDWFKAGVECAMMAPTAMNQQKFLFELVDENMVSAKALAGPFSKVDLGIVKYHFEIGAGKDNFLWK